MIAPKALIWAVVILGALISQVVVETQGKCH